ncbi:hypothetical protein H4V99_000104 [Cryobacterium sp. CG_9.6]|nr:hypothetical protein [Cryobacterium sp. CG_9.6]
MAASGTRMTALSVLLVVLILTGCSDTSEKASPAMGDETRPAATATVIEVTSLSAGAGAPVATRILDACSVDPLGSISNPDAPRAYSCFVSRAALLTFPPAVRASEAASLVDESFAARSCTLSWPLVTPATQPALDALDEGGAAQPVQGGYDCNGQLVRVTFGRADNATIRKQVQTPSSPLSGIVVSEEPPIGLAPLDKVLDSGDIFVAFIETRVKYVDTTVCSHLRLC